MAKRKPVQPHNRTAPKPQIEEPKKRALSDNEVLEVELVVATAKDGLVKMPKFECIGVSIDPPFVRYHKVKDKETFDVNMNLIAHVNMVKKMKLVQVAPASAISKIR
jgi:hypothetical protein